MARPLRRALLLGAALASVAGCGGGSESAPPPDRQLAKQPPVVLAAGDIADCGFDGDEETARLIEHERGVVAPLGDNAYESGTPAQYRDCYGPTWGRFKQRTRPALGGHEYLASQSAAGYFGYFGRRAGPPGRGYYSYDLGSWHVVVLNASCAHAGGCERGSPQERWLRTDLAAHRAPCTLAYWHDPRFSSGVVHGSARFMAPLWQALYDAGADVVLSGHEHNYERFAPQTADGRLDRRRGVREFVVGTGGRLHYRFGPPLPNSEVRNADSYGVLKLTLRPGGYSWRFIPVAGSSFTDAGSGRCHP